MTSVAAKPVFPGVAQQTILPGNMPLPSYLSHVTGRAHPNSRREGTDPFADRKTHGRDPGQNLTDASRRELIDELRDNFTTARKSRKAGNHLLAHRHYSDALERLDRRIVHGSQQGPLFTSLEEGRQLRQEALMGAALFAEGSMASGHMDGLYRFVEGINTEGADAEASRGEIMIALNLMRQAMLAPDPDFEKLEGAFGILTSTRMEISEWLAENLELAQESGDPNLEAIASDFLGLDMLAAVLSIEVAARLISNAYHSQQWDIRDSWIDELDAVIKQLVTVHSSESPLMSDTNDEIIATYIADVAKLFFRAERPTRALETAHLVADVFRNTKAKEELLKPDGIFKDFMPQGKLLGIDFYRERQGIGIIKKGLVQMQAGLAFQHSKSLPRTVVWEGVAALATGLGIYLGTESVLGAFHCAGIGAGVVGMAHRLWNGMMTQEAKQAAARGSFDRMGEKGLVNSTGIDVARLAAHGVKDFALWTVVGALITSGIQNTGPLEQVAMNAADGAGAAINGAYNLPAHLGAIPEGIASSLQAVSASEGWDLAGQFLYHSYTKGSFALYLARYLEPYFPGIKRLTDNQLLTLLMMPGMAYFAADAGEFITGTDQARWKTVMFDGVIGMEALAMTYISGLQGKRGQIGKTGLKDIFNPAVPATFGSRLVALNEFLKGNANFKYPLGAMFTGGVLVGPLSGVLQGGYLPKDPMLAFLMGSMITVFMLPVAAIEACVLGNIDLVGGWHRGVQDLGEDASRVAKVLAGADGALSAMARPFLFNRASRSVSGDLLSAGPAAAVGMYTLEGQILRSFVNLIAVNGWFTSIFPEISDTGHERKALRRNLTTQSARAAIADINYIRQSTGRIAWEEWSTLKSHYMSQQKIQDDDLDVIREQFKKGGQLLHCAHNFQRHKSLRSNLWTFLSLTRILDRRDRGADASLWDRFKRRLPDEAEFAHVPNKWLYTSLWRMLNRGLADKPTKRQLRKRDRLLAKLDKLRQQFESSPRFDISEAQKDAMRQRKTEIIQRMGEILGQPEQGGEDGLVGGKTKAEKIMEDILKGRIRGDIKLDKPRRKEFARLLKEYRGIIEALNDLTTRRKKLLGKILRTQDRLTELPSGAMQEDEVLEDGHVKVLFRLIETDIDDPTTHEYLYPLLETLDHSIARDGARNVLDVNFSVMIDEFFKTHPQAKKVLIKIREQRKKEAEEKREIEAEDSTANASTTVRKVYALQDALRMPYDV